MEIVKTENTASVLLADLRVSIDELEIYEAALSHILKTLSPEEIENNFGATEDEIEGMRDDLRQILIDYSESKQEEILV